MSASEAIRCLVRYHRGIEQDDTVPEDNDPYDTLLLRVSVMLPGSPEGVVDELQLHGRWAAMLNTVGPGDMMLLEGVEELSDAGRSGRCFSVAGAAPAVTIYREGFQHRMDKSNVETLELPDWLRIPPSKKVDGVYRYHRWLCTLRDGADANLFAVVWENAKPGPLLQKGWARHNFVVVDPSFEHAACADWSSNRDFPLYTISVSLKGQALESLPYFTVGDVVRVHRARISAKPPRFMNIRQQSGSAIVAFPCPAELVDAEATGDVESRAVSGEKHTIVGLDISRARTLQAWIQRRLRQQTMSAYLVMVQDLLQSGAKRDVIVQVLEIDVPRKTLLVSDGSCEPVRVEASEPPPAAGWLFAQLSAGTWLRLQGVHSAPGEGDEVRLRANAALITRVPQWCLDVERRRKQMEQEPAAEPEAKAPVEEVALSVPTPALAPAAASPRNTKTRNALAAEAPRESRGSGDTTELDDEEEQETPPAPGIRSEAAAPAESAEAAPKAQLTTVYADSLEAKRLRDVAAAAQRGERCLVLSHFCVKRICTVGGADATTVESLVAVVCQACKHTYAASSFVGHDVRAAKRARKVLPCGHWLFRLEFRFKMVLQEGDSSLLVFETGETSDLLGVSAEQVLVDQGARASAQKRLDALREDLGRPRTTHRHSLAVYRYDGPLYGAYAICDTALQLLS